MANRTLAALTGVVLLTCTGSPTAWGQCQANESAKLLASDGAYYDAFGRFVAISGDTALVGAHLDKDEDDPGSAYVFRFDGSTWVEEAKLLASDGADGDNFGIVAISGDTAAIGAYNDNDNGYRSGSAYIFRFDGSTWVEEVKLTASDGAARDRFGLSVAISGDTALVGAPNHDGSGAAYVFRFNGSLWVEEAMLTPSGGGPYYGFGSVAISGGTALVGANGDDSACPSDVFCDSGAAYVFRFDGSSWVEEAKLTASDGEKADLLGLSVSIYGDTALVGAQYDGDNGHQSGAAYIFHFDGSTWVEEAKLAASDAAPEDLFGASVSISGDTALVGAFGEGVESGAAYVFRPDGSSWVEEAKLLASDGAVADRFGGQVGISGDTALVGAAGDDDSHTGTGSAYVFRGLSDCNDNTLLDLCEVSEGTAQDCNNNDVPDECDIAGGTSIDENGNGIPDECEVAVHLDIKPGSCPNPVNPRAKGVVPVAVLGSESFDVTQIDIHSLTLARADGIGGVVVPLSGPPGPGITADDVATPLTGDLCECHDLAGDGIDDLLLKFSTPELADVLELRTLPPGTSVALTVGGSLLDGTLFEASDCIVIPGKQPRVRPRGKRVRR